MTSRIAVLAIDAVHPEVLSRFWCQVLGWAVLEQDEVGISIGPPDGGAGIDLLAVPAVKEAKNRLHLDLRADGSTQDEEVARLIGLGAEPVDIGQGPDVSWVVLSDPEGNEFCVLSRSAQDVRAEVSPAAGRQDRPRLPGPV